MKRSGVMALVVCLSGFAWAGDTRAEHLQRLQKAGDVFQEIMATPDKAIPVQVLDGARCVAVVPDMFKAGFIIGGRHGKGVATCKTPGGWSAPAFFTVSGGSWGAQIGAQSIDLVMMIMNDEGMQDLLKGQFEVGGSVSAAAGPVGRQASASGGWGAAILTYSRSKGIFAGAVLEGAKVSLDEDATEDVYGSEDITAEQILSGKLKAPPQAQGFIGSVANAKRQAAGPNQKND